MNVRRSSKVFSLVMNRMIDRVSCAYVAYRVVCCKRFKRKLVSDVDVLVDEGGDSIASLAFVQEIRFTKLLFVRDA